MPRQSPENFVRHVTRRIALIRVERGLTQADAAQRLGVAVKNWQRIEQGQNLTLHTLARVSAVLRCSPVDLVGSGSVGGDQKD